MKSEFKEGTRKLLRCTTLNDGHMYIIESAREVPIVSIIKRYRNSNPSYNSRRMIAEERTPSLVRQAQVVEIAYQMEPGGRNVANV